MWTDGLVGLGLFQIAKGNSGEDDQHIQTLTVQAQEVSIWTLVRCVQG
jgi:hypothetical protein